MGLASPPPPGDDPHASAAWAETPAETVLEQAEDALAGGDLPRARSLIASLLRRPSLSSREVADAWDLSLAVAVEAGDRTGAREAVVGLASRLPTSEVRRRIRAAWESRPADPEFENELLAAASDRAALASPGGSQDDDPVLAPDPSVQRLLQAIGGDPHLGDVGAPDPAALTLFTGGEPPYSGSQLRSPLDPSRLRALMAEDDEEAELPLVEGTEIGERRPEEIHRIIADHPGTSGRELLRRYASEQARRTGPEELQHSYDLAVELFGQEAWEEAAHLLLPVAMVENPERLGALELLARALYELDRLPQADAYLREAIPTDRQVREPEYAPLFFWLGKIAEERGDPGAAIDFYASAVRLAPDIVEAKRRLQALLAL